ncbi:type II toxin-antitoxin system VapC family toxin [Lederbergia wuyishanensis]|uniref:Nucleic acid-binding protein n=1 Tax=Lederbergia wuyishanensis TaxID=1347903 RepID=A0ABU0D2E0_9BACI|nr:type II toxin-antitoxin system VapC family toxin [Lederbergia wuyishanensis]MCJ8007291.1 type II toxin-antitoxin system VapC family toxin [Lederbergia wuyishanensis]MDQ0342552.1 putative nucleic acid-binding protein [Lederbergia wuyishanensis]
MKYLLDTNVISELVKKDPHPGVLHWIDDCDETSLYLSVITFGELQKGISKLSDTSRAERLQKWVDQDLANRFKERILPIDLDVVFTWGRVHGISEKSGTKLPVVDSLIAATAITHNLTVVTRNVNDIERCRAPVFNPWDETYHNL